MSINRFAARRDENEPAIVAALRALGYTVHLIKEPCDLLVGKRGRTHLVEVKQELGPRGGVRGRKLTRDQDIFSSKWRGCFHVVRGWKEAHDMLERCSLE